MTHKLLNCVQGIVTPASPASSRLAHSRIEKTVEDNILIAVPVYGGQIHYRCAESLRLLDRQLIDLGIAHTIRYIVNESLVTRARNWFANLALFGADEGGAAFSHLLFVDADLAFNAKDIVSMIQADKPIVALPYALKRIDWQNVVNAVKSGVTAEQLPHYLCNPVVAMLDGQFNPNEITPVRSAGTGLMLIKISVLQKMAAAHPNWEYKIGASEVRFRGAEGKAFDFFQAGAQSTTEYYLSVDFFFAEEANKLGLETYLLPWVQTTHSGTFQYQMNIPAIVALDKAASK